MKQKKASCIDDHLEKMTNPSCKPGMNIKRANLHAAPASYPNPSPTWSHPDLSLETEPWFIYNWRPVGHLELMS